MASRQSIAIRGIEVTERLRRLVGIELPTQGKDRELVHVQQLEAIADALDAKIHELGGIADTLEETWVAITPKSTNGLTMAMDLTPVAVDSTPFMPESKVKRPPKPRPKGKKHYGA